MKLCTIVGARPQFIKAAMVSRALRRMPEFVEVLVHTGQHYDHGMSQLFFEELDIPRPAYNLGIGPALGGRQTARMLEALDGVLRKEKPDRVLVYGDTNSTLAGTLAAAKLGLPVAHVEAGLRSFNWAMVEEVNRVLTDHLSDLLFVPTTGAADQLRKEGIRSEMIHRVGDVMFDAALHYADAAERKSHVLENLRLAHERYALATVHRAENTDDNSRLAAIVDCLLAVVEMVPVVLPLHPRTRCALQRAGLFGKLKDRLSVIPPVGYLDMLMLVRHARVIVTDSGGVQKEAFFYRTPCITLRDETEWVELVENGYNYLVGADRAKLTATLGRLEQVHPEWGKWLYGTGNAADEILRVLACT